MSDDAPETYGNWPVVPDADGPWLQVDRLEGVEPLTFGPGMPPAPDPLMPHLFGPLDPDEAETAAWGNDPIPDARSYAILDAGALPMLADRLAASGLPHDCLFSGKARDDLGEAAPWIVELEPGNPFVNALMSVGRRGAGLWDKRAGIYIRSRQPMDAVRAHFRKFTRLADDQGAWFFNRFWAPSVSTTLMELGNAAVLVPFVSPLFPAGRHTLRMIVLSDHGNAVLSRIPGTVPPTARPVLTDGVKQWMQHIRRVQQFEDLIDIAIRHVSQKSEIDAGDAAAHLRQHRDKFFSIGFWRRDHLVSLCVWELMLGPNFIHDYEGGHIKQIIRGSEGDWQAIRNIGNFLEPPPPEPTEAEVAAMINAADAADAADDI